MAVSLPNSPLDDVFRPEEQLGDLFAAVQLQSVFPDSKTFVDCVPLFLPESIVKSYNEQKSSPSFNLTTFVLQNFAMPPNPSNSTVTKNLTIVEHINELWPILTRHPGSEGKGLTSLIPLPNDYVVPGGRFREVYYWDSFFTMLGLKRSGLVTLIQDIIDNFAYLINLVGHIPNGNRGYFLSRSQPPFFSMMVKLLAETKGDLVLLKYANVLNKEYNFWMDGEASLTEKNNAFRRVVRMPDGTVLNRFWDDSATPRPESYKEDVIMAEESGRNPEDLYRNIRAAAESGWDFSGRWFADGMNMHTIRTTELIPIDLNALMYDFELTLAKIAFMQLNKEKGNRFLKKAEARRDALLKYCWSEKNQFFYDYDFINGKTTDIPTLAAGFLLYFKMTTSSQAAGIAAKLGTDFLLPGGLPTTLTNTTQQWDAPNGWAPLQWMNIQGLKNYGYNELASTITQRWIALNTEVYNQTGKLVEKYNVESIDTPGGGGEYPTQDGFGWSNGVFLDLYMSKEHEEKTTLVKI